MVEKCAALAPAFLFFLGCTKAAPSTAAAIPDAGACTSPEFQGSPLGVHCNALVDKEGRTVLLHGINARVAGVFDVTFTDGRQPVQPIPEFGAADAARIRALGFNALRLPINWSGVEPTEDGGIVTGYLEKVAAVTQVCAAAGLFVVIDLHQDQYSKEIGEDGAPLWAIVPPPTIIPPGPLTERDGSTGLEVGEAFATFFDTAADGQGLRDRYTQMAVQVASYFASDPAVAGFELFNEPLAADDYIHPLYSQMVPALRAAAPEKLLFWEPGALRNELDSAPLGDGGSFGAGTVYSPHVYTLAFTATPTTTFTEATLAPSNESARAEADSWASPLVITEYGFAPSQNGFADYVGWQQDLQDQVRGSGFFWLWKEQPNGSWGFYDFPPDGGEEERPAVVQAMTRARLEAVAGELVSVSFDSVARRLEIDFIGSSSVTAPNMVSIGAGATTPASGWVATCDGEAVATGGADPLAIACGGPGEHVLLVHTP